MGRHRSELDVDAPLVEVRADQMQDGSLGQSAARGTIWLAAQRWVLRLSGLITIAILTRLLTPEEFGVVAVATAVIPFVLILSELGLSVFIVQAPRLTHRILCSAFWFCLVVAIVLSTLLVLLSPAIANLMRVPAATEVLQVMSLSVVVVVLGSVPMALLRRRLQFRLLALQAALGGVIAQAVAIVMALRGAGAGALVAQLLVAQTISTVLAWRSAGWRPGLHLSRRAVGEMARFGINIVLTECVGTGRAAGESAVVAYVLGPVALGYLSIAQRLVVVVQDSGAAAVVPVSTVVFAKLRDAGGRLREAYLRSTSIAYMTVAPLLGFLAISAPLMVTLLFGDEWEASVPIAQGLAVAAILTLGAVLDQGLFYGVGRPGLWFSYAVVIDGLSLIITGIAAHWGLTMVAWGFVMIAVVATLFRWVLNSRIIDTPIPTIAAPLVRALGPTALSVGAGWILLFIFQGSPTIIVLACAAATVGIVHVAMVRLLQPRVLIDLFTMLPFPARVRRALERITLLPVDHLPTAGATAGETGHP